MKHLHLTETATVRLAEERVRSMHASGSRKLVDLVGDLHGQISRPGTGQQIDEEPLEDARAEIEALLDLDLGAGGTAAASDQDMFEGKAAVVVYSAVRATGADAGVVADPGFWRYVGLAYTWNFAAWRETNGFGLRPAENGRLAPARSLRDYVNGRKFHECVPQRMYLRMSCLGGDAHQSLASAVRLGTDFWRSHILRVIAGEHPPIVRAMVRRQADERTRLNRDPLREFAKQLDRTLTNLVADLLDDAAADDLVGELWNRQLS